MSLRLIRIRLYLALDQVVRFLSRIVLFWLRGKGAEVFFQRYRPDHVVAVLATERHGAPDFERCQVCSLCTLSCEAIRADRAPAAFEPKQIVAVFGRYSQDSEIFLEEWYPCVQCQACTVLCPNQVPIHAMAEQIIHRRGRLGFRRGTQRDRI